MFKLRQDKGNRGHGSKPDIVMVRCGLSKELIKLSFCFEKAVLGTVTMTVWISLQYAPYKSGAKTTLAERARKLGLDTAAKSLQLRPAQFQLQRFVEQGVEGKFKTLFITWSMYDIETLIKGRQSMMTRLFNAFSMYIFPYGCLSVI